MSDDDTAAMLARARIPFPKILLRRGYDREGNRWNVDPDRHLLHAAGSTPALDVRAVRWWNKNGITKVRVHLRDGRILWCILSQFIEAATRIDYGHGEQFVATKSMPWFTEAADDLLHYATTKDD